MLTPGTIIKLSPRTPTGQNKINRWGEFWEVLSVQDKVLFSSIKGPWIEMRNQDRTKGASFRWVHESEDVDFKIYES